MKKLVLPFSLSGALFMSGMGATGVNAEAKFVDMPAVHWAEKEIQFLQTKGVVSGYKDGTYKPANLITRAQAAVVFAKVLKLNGSNQSAPGLKDVNPKHHNYKAIAAVIGEGLLGTDKNGAFHPDAPLSRAELAEMMAKAFKLEGFSPVPFSDVNQDIPQYKAIQALVDHGITAGANGLFAPDKKVSRAELAALVARVLNDTFKLEARLPEFESKVTLTNRKLKFDWNATNFSLSVENYGKENVPGEGHAHLYVKKEGEEGLGKKHGVKTKQFELDLPAEEYPPGKYVITTSLETNDHQHVPVDMYTYTVEIKNSQAEVLPEFTANVTLKERKLKFDWDATNFTLSVENYGKANVPGEGHAHLYIKKEGEEGLGKKYGVKTKQFELDLPAEEYPAGKYVVTASLETNDHQHVPVDMYPFTIEVK